MRPLLLQGLVLVLLTAITSPGTLPGAPEKPGSSRIPLLIRQLGDDLFEQRQAASKDLEAIGEQALPAVRKAVASDDLEVRWRARDLLEAILLAASKSTSTGLELVVIDAGEAKIGSPGNESSRRADEVLHEVTITRSFLLGKYEVTQDEYRKVLGSTPSWFTPTSDGKDKVKGQNTDRYPVERVSWYDAIDFCNRLSKRDGFPPYYKITDLEREKESITKATVTPLGGTGYRLPTEAEWEYACRAGTVSPYHFGLHGSRSSGNFRTVVSTGYGSPSREVSLARTAQVGSYPSNLFGLHDMHGNVAEWCWDWYDRDYYRNSPRNDPHGPDRGDHRVLRGGSWLVSISNSRSATRFWSAPGAGAYYTGFRVARTPP